MQMIRSGECIDRGALIPEIDFDGVDMHVSTDRYHAREYLDRERDRLWMRVWQIAGRADELPEAGDWKLYTVFDQSYVLVRDKDGAVRGFVNACRHRGNALCKGTGHAARFVCPYHGWSYALDGRLLAVSKPDFKGPVEDFVGHKESLGLLAVPVECFAGFVFLNPDRNAAPLAEFLGAAADVLASYHLEDMIPVGMDVRESIRCNWKVVMDAFQEGYHVQGVHPELVPFVDLSQERFRKFGVHSATTVPFGGPAAADASPEREIQTIRELPVANFPGLSEILPRFEELVAQHVDKGRLQLPPGVSARTLLQQATRDILTRRGLDVSGLTDTQMSDFQFWLLFPNVFIQIRAGEAIVIVALPHPDGDPNRCIWHVTSYLWLPPEQRAKARAELHDVPEGQHFPYFLALEQDYQQMECQQAGLRNTALTHLALTKQEPKVAHFHGSLNDWIGHAAR